MPRATSFCISFLSFFFFRASPHLSPPYLLSFPSCWSFPPSFYNFSPISLHFRRILLPWSFVLRGLRSTAGNLAATQRTLVLFWLGVEWIALKCNLTLRWANIPDHRFWRSWPKDADWPPLVQFLDLTHPSRFSHCNYLLLAPLHEQIFCHLPRRYPCLFRVWGSVISVGRGFPSESLGFPMGSSMDYRWLTDE